MGSCGEEQLLTEMEKGLYGKASNGSWTEPEERWDGVMSVSHCEMGKELEGSRDWKEVEDM